MISVAMNPIRSSAVFDREGKEIERPRSRRVDYLPVVLELGIVAGTDELTCSLIPWNCTAEVGAPLVQGEEATVGESSDVETTVDDVRHGAGRKVVDGPGYDGSAEFAFGEPRLQIGEENAADFDGGQPTDGCPRHG